MAQPPAKNILLAGISTATYYATTCSGKTSLEESAIFGVINGLLQQFVPHFVTDEQIQLLIIDPLISSFVNAGVKYAIGYDIPHIPKELGRGVVAGISGSAITNYMYYGKKSW